MIYGWTGSVLESFESLILTYRERNIIYNFSTKGYGVKSWEPRNWLG